MVVQKTFNNLKDGPKEDKVVVASGVAISVVLILLVAWAIYFFHSLQNGSQQVRLGGGAGSQFNSQNVTDAQKQLEQQFGSPTQEYQNIQQDSAAGNNGQMQTQQMQIDGQTNTQFGTGSN